MNAATLIVSSLSLVVSSATLVVVLVGAKKVEHQIEEVRVKSNEGLKKLKNALAEVQF